MEMSRADFARWLLLLAISVTIVSAVAGSAIGVICGATYIAVALLATLDDLVQKGAFDGKEND